MDRDLSSDQAKTWGMLCHLSALIGYLILPFGNILGPLVIWLLKKEEFPFVDEQGKEALNFQISMTIYAAVASVLVLILIGFILLPVIYLGGLILLIIASVKAKDGVSYRYPMTIRFIQ